MKHDYRKKQQKSNDERTRYLMTGGFTKMGPGALIYNSRVIRCYTGIGSNIHRQDFIFSCHDNIKCIAFHMSFYFNMVFQPKA